MSIGQYTLGIVAKLISKVLVEQLKTVLVTIISPEQTTFVKGRNIVDGALILNKIMA